MLDREGFADRKDVELMNGIRGGELSRSSFSSIGGCPPSSCLLHASTRAAAILLRC